MVSNHNIHRILVDNGSSSDILYWSTKSSARKNHTVTLVTPPKLALANLVKLLAITQDKTTCESMGNHPSSIIKVNV
jgi:hypothetical protein